MADDSGPADHTILICTKCRGSEAANQLRRALAGDVGYRYRFRAVDCMAACDRQLTIGFQAYGKASYLFGDIDGAVDTAAIAEFALQYRQSVDGWTSASERPAALYTKTLARLPAERQRHL